MVPRVTSSASRSASTTSSRTLTIPPGSITVTDDGGRTQDYLHDFFNYAGLARSVWLYSAPAVRVPTSRHTDVEGSTGIVGFDSRPTGADSVRVRAARRRRRVVATGTGIAGALRVDDVRLWQPGAALPLRPDGRRRSCGDEVVDEYSLPVGVRTIEVAGHRFLINGEPFYFTGFGRHEDSAVRGKGHDNAYLVHDFQLMDWIGANSFRTSHYPYAEEVMEFADRHGIVVIDEVGAVGLNLAMGGGIFGGQAYTTFSPETINDQDARDARAGDPRAHRAATRTTRASCCGPSRTSPRRTRRAPRVLRAARDSPASSTRPAR